MSTRVSQDFESTTLERHFTTVAVSVLVLLFGGLAKIGWDMNNSLQKLPTQISNMEINIAELKGSMNAMSSGYLPRREAEQHFGSIHDKQQELTGRVQRLEDKQ